MPYFWCLNALLAAACLVPYLLGTLLAQASGYPIRWSVAGLGLWGTLTLYLAALAARETFAPGISRWPALGGRHPQTWKRLAYIFLGLAGAAGLLLQFHENTGELTLPLGGLGLVLGYFTFAPPLAWCRRGLSELTGGVAFGVLPVLAGYYLQCGHVISEILVLGLPLSLAAFNLFLIWGLPLPLSTAIGEGLSLATRLRPPAVGLLFTVVNILMILLLVVALLFPASPYQAWCGLLGLLGVALGNQELIKRRAYVREDRLRLLSGLLMAQQVGMGLIFSLGLWGRL